MRWMVLGVLAVASACGGSSGPTEADKRSAAEKYKSVLLEPQVQDC